MTATPNEQAVINAAVQWFAYGDKASLIGLRAACEALISENVTYDPTDFSPPIWVPATWRDVRQADTVRMPGQEGTQALVYNLGPVNHWHAAPNASQYRPNESPLEWASIPVTLSPLAGGPAFTPEHGMNPDAPVEIEFTEREWAAIEALGGLRHRV